MTQSAFVLCDAAFFILLLVSCKSDPARYQYHFMLV